ncbi:unnamed protein product [Protopolystoma xenopodis]|uniref:Low-density lipoprotein receptor domain class A n=1 Tax=Protopolystoma xenopodis TaxID=117903 RepID=A0A3S5FCB6_9PLAT|nr:unnamed protein product [Protopolystoma xenopodis]
MPAELQLTPATQRIRPGVPFELTCISSDPSIAPSFRTIPAAPSVRVIRQGPGRETLRFLEGIDHRGNGTIVECYAPGAEPKRAYVFLDDACPVGFRRCNSGHCIHLAKFCDGNIDCPDGSDESPERCRKCHSHHY